MKKRWFVVILTIGLLLCVMPLSALALSSDPITDSDGNIIGWEDLSTDLYSFDDSDVSDVSQEQTPVVVAPAPHAASGPAETDPVKGAAAAYRSSTNGVAEDAAVHDPNADDDPIPDLYEDPTDSATDTGSNQAVCAIGTQTYETLTEAINDAAYDAKIKLLKDIELTEGLRFENKKLTISGGNTYTLTLEESGIYANSSDITFKDLTLTIDAHTHPYEGAGNTANLITNSSELHLSHVEFKLTPDKILGSGIFLEHDSDLYFEDNTNAVISGFSAEEASGIYAESYSKDGHGIWVTSSSLKVTDCDWNAMTIDPINLTLDNADVYLTRNGKDGYGALGCYHGKLTMTSSTLVADDNPGAPWSFTVFVRDLEMYSGSTLQICGNDGNGLGVGGKGVIHSGATLICDNNGVTGYWPGSGLYVYAGPLTDVFDKVTTVYKAKMTIESGANVSVCGNVFAGIQNSWELEIQGGATVAADRNITHGIYNSFDADLTIKSCATVSASSNGKCGILNQSRGDIGIGDFVIESGANVTADSNGSYGICNRNIFTVEEGTNLQVEHNKNSGILNEYAASLTLLSGTVRYNHAKEEKEEGFSSYGGGIQNYGTAILSDDVQLYNNHADVAGDDIYNNQYGAKITFGPTGSDWALDGYPDCYHPIDGWYDDSVNDRWNAHAEHEDDLHMLLTDPVTSYTDFLALKAAHGPTGSLIVHKRTTGEQLVDDCDAEFTFVLTLDDETINTVNDERYGVRFENGKATFTLKDGESKAIENLPARMGYTITEQSKGGWLLARVDGDAEGKVPYRATAEIAFVNEKQTATGSLVVTKELAGELDADDADTVFNFMLMLDDNTITTADAEEYGVQFENGIASFSLKGGESITIANLPAGVGYTIAEVRQTGWTLQSVSGADTGVVPKNDTAEIVFTNRKNGTDIPDVPVVPTEPEEPTEPESPKTPETPEEPAEPDAPAQDETPGEEPAQDDTTVPAQPAETPAQDTTKADTLPQTGTTGWLAVVLMSFGFGLLACGWFFTRKQRAAKH